MSDEKKGIIGTITDGLKESAKTQHQITKTRHAISKKTPREANSEFRARHAYAKKPPIEKQRDELERLQDELVEKTIEKTIREN